MCLRLFVWSQAGCDMVVLISTFRGGVSSFSAGLTPFPRAQSGEGVFLVSLETGRAVDQRRIQRERSRDGRRPAPEASSSKMGLPWEWDTHKLNNSKFYSVESLLMSTRIDISSILRWGFIFSRQWVMAPGGSEPGARRSSIVNRGPPSISRTDPHRSSYFNAPTM